MKQEQLLRTIISPHMSEKAAMGTETQSQYVFKVLQSATKQTVKEAIEQLFKAKVQAVRIVNVKTKPRRFGSIEGRSKAWKKAYVTLQAGQRIELGETK
jgi:large subunit ribosomal protein L23